VHQTLPLLDAGHPRRPENSDANVGADLVSADPTIATTDDQPIEVPIEVLGDSAYGTGDMLAVLATKKWTAVIKPWPIKPAIEGGFTIDDFTHDPESGTVTCPAGVTRHITQTRNVVFGGACASCPLRSKCTNSKTGRTLHLHPHDLLQRVHRRRASDDDGARRYSPVVLIDSPHPGRWSL
jgi:hypothetical protein